ncbi:MAG: TetR/AcrR family transcriptional regulator [Solirubrobacterales bacterium]|nr:TetR/AcrR family transcriptional regulator [Solirubrobacterales bacterium]
MTPKPTQSRQPRAARSDGLRNRQQVLEAATAAFSTVGLGASVNDIARRASVGVGTLYRHFPTKEALLAEVLRARLGELLAVSREFTDRHGDDPGELLRSWVQAVAAQIGEFTAVHEWVITALTSDPELRDLHHQVLAEGQTLLTDAQGVGRASAEARIGDLVGAIAALAVTATPDDPERPARLLRLLIDGLLTAPDAADAVRPSGVRPPRSHPSSRS